MRLTAIGWRAHAALMASGGGAKVTAPLSRSYYVEAAGALIWVGDPDAPLHPRAALTTNPRVPAAGASIHIALDGIAPWRPALPRIRRDAAIEGAHVLRTVVPTLGSPRGLARLLVDDPHDDPVITRATPHIRALAAACARDDARAAGEAARPLLGLGDGLTPSGDDYVGGVLFARRLYGETDQGWEAMIARVVTDASTLTHPISARLLTDLAAGEGWAPLHDLANALGAGVASATGWNCTVESRLTASAAGVAKCPISCT